MLLDATISDLTMIDEEPARVEDRVRFWADGVIKLRQTLIVELLEEICPRVASDQVGVTV